MQPDLCTFCHRRERYAKLLICADCCERLVGRPTAQPVPAWRRRDLSRDETGRMAA